MSNLPVTFNNLSLPAHLQKGKGEARSAASELSGGVTSSFPLISYRGKVWRVRRGGEEVDFLDANGDPVQSVELVLVKSNPRPSKTFYERKYEAGSVEPPRCWSSDGMKPDSAVLDPVHNSCATCPKNQWGSRISEDGKKGRACADVRKLAVAFLDEITKKGEAAHVCLLRVPPASLTPLKDYAEKVLGPAGIEYFTIATRVGFDPAAAHPKLTFRPVVTGGKPRFLDPDEYATILALRESDEVRRMLAEDSEYAGAGTTGTDKAAANIQPQKEVAAPAPVSKPQPVEEEDVSVEIADELPVPQEKAKKKTAKAKPKPIEDEDEIEAAPSTNGESFDDVLDNLLGN